MEKLVVKKGLFNMFVICQKNHPKYTRNEKKRKKYFEERRTTSHWPCPIKVNGKQGRNFGNERLRINYENLRKPDLADMMDEINRLL